MLAKDVALLEGAEGSQITGSKCKEINFRDKEKQQPPKKAKGKQPEKYHRDIRIKIGSTNPCERCVSTRQDCLVHYSR